MIFSKRIPIIIAICLFYASSAFARNDTIQLSRSWGLQVGGFARVDYIYDSRQTAEAVEGLFTFYPMPKQLDANGKDINATPKANFISIATRLSTRFFAPDLMNAKTSAYVEVDFTGTSNTNGIRLRQAYINFAWAKSSLLLGRTWHPLATGCIPTNIGLNTGAPFWVFNRSDQVLFTYNPTHWVLSAAASYQSDYASSGPASKSPDYLRNAVWPEFSINASYKTTPFQIGVVGSTKTLKPRLYTTNAGNQTYKTDETLTTFAAQAYFRFQWSDWVIKGQSTYAQNTTESMMVGGYAVSEIDPATGHEEYTPTQYMNYWLNVDYGKKWQAGVFLGYLNSLGTLDDVTGSWYARAPNIKYMYRIAPHLFYNIRNWQFAGELEYTAAAYGDIQNDQRGKIINASEVANLRMNLMISFFF